MLCVHTLRAGLLWLEPQAIAHLWSLPASSPRDGRRPVYEGEGRALGEWLDGASPLFFVRTP